MEGLKRWDVKTLLAAAEEGEDGSSRSSVASIAWLLFGVVCFLGRVSYQGLVDNVTTLVTSIKKRREEIAEREGCSRCWSLVVDST